MYDRYDLKADIETAGLLALIGLILGAGATAGCLLVLWLLS